MLTEVDYNVAPFRNFSHLSRSNQDLDDLKIAMRRLKGFQIAWPSVPRADHTLDDEEGMRHLKAFVEAFTDTDSIESLSIDMDHLWPPEIAPRASAGGLPLTRA